MIGKLNPNRLKLSTRITWNYALIFTSILLIINFAVYASTQIYNRVASSTEVSNLSSSVVVLLSQKDEVTPEDMRSLGVIPPYYASVTSSKGTVYSIEDTEIGIQDGKMILKRPGRETSSLSSSEKSLTRGETTYSVTVVKDLNVYRFLNTVNLVTLIIASLMGVVVSYVVGIYMSRQSFDPIIKMTKSAAAIGPSNMYDRVILPEAKDEIRDLGETFNGLLDRLDNAYSNQAKFVSDASHELRTPLTVIKGYTDMLRRWGKSDREILDESIDAIKAECENMALLVENLLFIAKGENRKLNISPARFNLKDMLLEVDKEGDFNLKGRDIVVEAGSFEIVADRKMIKQLVRIFVDNSVKFTEAGSVITLTAELKGERYVMKVIDRGEGIPKEDLAKIFERFYVADKARTKDKAGSGLGLSIAKWIVDTHKGTLTAESEQGIGTTMIVEMPVDVNA
ncbi:sensor histidine kinase [Youngiibacter fragilis]|uniref:histidine kinase n=1 Tax=Youngiibacter fragilis 232.1 TaxID=994573 RepID=V7I1N5_9CLOT|nr:HAMP domain-containing sensor histidine kinase [Youngiibacter fragilis]ETA78937.1 integral membrane sensor signal transduction histidine kinase [Youngiibacter fragilis 232.1]